MLKNNKKSKLVACHDIHGKIRMVRPSELAFRPSAYGIVFDGAKVLLTRPFGGYDFPGGGVHNGETVQDALIRECWEETGMRVRPIKLLHCQTSFFALPGTGRAVNAILIYFLCRRTGGRLTEKNFDRFEKKDHSIAEWVTLSKIRNLKFYNSINSVRLIRQAYAIKHTSP